MCRCSRTLIRPAAVFSISDPTAVTLKYTDYTTCTTSGSYGPYIVVLKPAPAIEVRTRELEESSGDRVIYVTEAKVVSPVLDPPTMSQERSSISTRTGHPRQRRQVLEKANATAEGSLGYSDARTSGIRRD